MWQNIYLLLMVADLRGTHIFKSPVTGYIFWQKNSYNLLHPVSKTYFFPCFFNVHAKSCNLSTSAMRRWTKFRNVFAVDLTPFIDSGKSFEETKSFAEFLSVPEQIVVHLFDIV